ncbi:MAG TPA: glucosidase, partial [Candidatus Competibacteraceae bacterium]|nr:glucosidase [Candidatus Competibacteraceae bacterium]
KEYYFYTDNTPTRSYMRWVYKYPQRTYPYDKLVRVNGQRNRLQPEYELLDTGIFDDNRYFDITAEYAKASPEDICLRLHIANRGPETAEVHVLPTLWLRNTWRWVGAHPPGQLTQTGDGIIELNHHTVGRRWLYCDPSGGRAPELLFTDNETNLQRAFSVANETPYVKDAFHRYLVHGEHAAVNPQAIGTKAAAHYPLRVAAGKTVTLQLRFTDHQFQAPFDPTFVQLFDQRQREADEFYRALTPDLNDKDVRTIQRQALAALLWTKQYYEYDVERWLQGDPAEPPPPPERLHGRNSAWRAFKAKNVISMPDKWEFPWFASWDWAFHCVVFSLIDPAFAKSQLQLPFSPTYLNPNGQVPAYEWGFGQVNPPIQAWATLKVYGQEKRQTGKGDHSFLKTMFQGLERNFDWWQSCEDSQRRGLYAGGFLGLDDIAVFNRNLALPTGGHLQQSDGTAWAAMFALALVEIALELACQDKTFVPKALHYLEKFLDIAKAMNYIGKGGRLALWDEQDGFYFSALVFPGGREELLKVYSLVGLAPLFATHTVEPQVQQLVPD